MTSRFRDINCMKFSAKKGFQNGLKGSFSLPEWTKWVKIGEILKNTGGIKKTLEKTWETLTPYTRKN